MICPYCEQGRVITAKVRKNGKKFIFVKNVILFGRER